MQSPQTNSNFVSNIELSILRLLQQRTASRDSVPAEIHEIVSLTGIRDSDEVIRALYTLEGKSFVTPEPAGDFTSNHWKITDVGVRALGILQQ